MCLVFFFFKRKTAYEFLIRDWSSDVCSSDLGGRQMRAKSKLGSSMTLLRENSGARFGLVGKLPWTWQARMRSSSMTGVFERSDKIGRASGRVGVCQYGSISVVAV